MARHKVSTDPFFNYFHEYFNTYLPKVKMASPETIDAYRASFTMLAKYCELYANMKFSDVVIDTLNYDFIAAFVAWLKDERKNAATTIALRLAAIKAFLGFCANKDPLYIAQYNSICKIPTPKIPDKGVASISPEGLKALLAQPDTSTDKGIRNLTFMTLMYVAGARMQEMLSLRICDIDIGDGIICLRITGKGNKTRTVPIDNLTAKHLLRYMEVFHSCVDSNSLDLLFYTVIHGVRCPMPDDCARAFIKKYAAQASEISEEIPKDIHPHQLRHSRAMHLYESGNSLIVVRDFLGHKSIATTDIYARASTKMLKAAISKVAPIEDGLDNDCQSLDMIEKLKDYLKKHRLSKAA